MTESIKIYHVDYSKTAIKQLRKLDAFTRKSILLWIDKNLEGTTNPWIHGKGLTANRAGKSHYRIGDYRILALIHEEYVTIQIFSIGHRRDIYDN